MRFVAVIPARNEATTVAATVTAALAVEGVARAIVVDDASTDGTAERAASAGAEVLRLPRRAGKADALERGMALLAADDGALLLDADLGETAAQAVLLTGPLVAGEADMVVATFPKPSAKAGFGLVKGLARGGIRRFGGGFEASAPLSGQRALTPAAIAAVRPLTGGFGAEVTMTVRVLRAGLRIREVPTTMAHRASGRDIAGFAHRGRQFAHVALALARLALER